MDPESEVQVAAAAGNDAPADTAAPVEQVAEKVEEKTEEKVEEKAEEKAEEKKDDAPAEAVADKEASDKAAAEKEAAEKAEKEAAEKAEKEKAEKEAAEKAEKEKADKEAAEKAEKEAAEKAAAEKEAADKAAAEKEAADKEAADKAAAEKEAEKPAEKEAEKPAEKEAEKEAEKPAEKEAEKPAEKEAEKPAEKEADKPADKPAEKEAEEPVVKPVKRGSNVAALAAGIKLPMMAPGMAPPPRRESASAASTSTSLPSSEAVKADESVASSLSFDTPMTDIKPLASVHKHKSQLAPKNRRAPTRALKVFLATGHASVVPSSSDTVATVTKHVLDKQESEEEHDVALYGLYTIAKNGDESLLPTDKPMSEVSQSLVDSDVKLFLKRLDGPTARELRADLFVSLLDSQAWPAAADPSRSLVTLPAASATASSSSVDAEAAARKRAEEEKRKADEEKKRAEEEKRKAEEEKKRAEDEARREAEAAAARKRQVLLRGVDVTVSATGTSVTATVNAIGPNGAPAAGKPVKGFPLEMSGVFATRVSASGDTADVIIHYLPSHKNGKSVVETHTFSFGDAEKGSAFYEQVRRNMPTQAPTPRALTVLINPVAGKRKGEKIFAKYVKNVFDALDFSLDVHVTTSPTHAGEIVSSLALSKTTGVLCIGGDGHAHDVFNALASRPDWETAVKTPVGIIAAGWNNLLALSAFGEAGARSAAHCALAMARGGAMPIDACSITREGHPRTFAVTQEYGFQLLADQQTEGLRWLGGKRMLIGAFAVGKRRLESKLYYLPVEERHVRAPVRVGDMTKESETKAEPKAAEPKAAEPKEAEPKDEPKAEAKEAEPATSPKEGEEKAASPATSPVESPKESAPESAPADAEKSSAASASTAAASPTSPMSPVSHTTGPATVYGTVSHAVPADWKYVEGSFAVLRAGKLPWSGPGRIAAPHAQPRDGAIELTFVRAESCSPAAGLKVFQRHEAGQPEVPEAPTRVESVKAKAYRFVPGADGETVKIDGTRTPCVAFQVEPHESLFYLLGAGDAFVTAKAK